MGSGESYVFAGSEGAGMSYGLPGNSDGAAGAGLTAGAGTGKRSDATGGAMGAGATAGLLGAEA